MIVAIQRFILPVLLFFLSVNYLRAQAAEWTRVAEPGYEVYAPVTLANGSFGITLSEKAFQGNAVQFGGAYDFFPDKGIEASIKAIDFSKLELIVMPPAAVTDERADFLLGKRLSRTDLGELEQWKQEFNFQEGWFATSFLFEQLKVEHTVYALQHMAQTAIIKLVFTAQDDLSFQLKNLLQTAPPYQMTKATYLQQLRDRQVPLFTALADSPSKAHQLATTSSFYFEGPEKPALLFEDENLQQASLSFRHHLKKGETLTCYLIGSMGSSHHFANPGPETARLNIYTFLKGPEKVIEEHKSHWKKFWASTDIIVEGAPELTKDLRQMMFFVNSFVREGSGASSACMGLGRDAWGHRVLWDADFWIYPALLLINPAAARSMLEYRWNRLEAAKNNARFHGYQGAMFPWESAASGEEQTPLLYLTGPFQHHITADVGLAFWNYYCVTQDRTFLSERAYPLLKEVADFWISRAEAKGNGQFVIKNVVSADEHAVNVDNDIFTNAAAKTVLEAATAAAKLLNIPAKLRWSEVAEGLYLGTFKDGITREHDTYQGETIKQASTNLASFPLSVINEPNKIKQNLKYYEQRVDEHGPNMTWPMYAGAAARAGDAPLAKYYFDKATQPYKKGPFAILALRPYLKTTFFGTSAGGLLQAFILGFGGLYFTAEGLVQKDPVLPKEWKSITLKGMGSKQTFTVK